MAQEDFNVSLPNDGLGDALRDAFVKQQGMNTELYEDKVDKVDGLGLSQNSFTNDEKVKLAGIEAGAEVNVQSDWLQDDNTADDFIKNKPLIPFIPSFYQDRIISLGTTTVIDDSAIFSIGFVWDIASQVYQNGFEITRELPYATAGNYRTHVAYLTDDNDILIQIGAEDTVITPEPAIPVGTLRLQAFNVFGETITAGEPSIYALGVNEFTNVTQINVTGGTVTNPSLGVIDIEIESGGTQDLQETLENGAVATTAEAGVTAYVNLGEDVGNGKEFRHNVFDESGNNGISVVNASSAILQNFAVDLDSEIGKSGAFDVVNGEPTIKKENQYGTDTAIQSFKLPELTEAESASNPEIVFVPKKKLISGIYELATMEDLPSGGAEWIVVSSSQTAVNDEQYSNVANATYTDPTPVEGKGYNVKVVNGTATIGGVGYAEGRLITRTFHSGSWRTKVYVDETIVGSATVTALKTKLDYWHVQVGALGSTNSTSESVLYVVDVPAGLYEIEDFFIFEANQEKDNINGNVTYRARAGVNGDTSDTLIATVIVGQNNSRTVNWDRRNARFDTATSLRTVPTASSLSTDSAITQGNASASFSLNPASAWKLTITAQNVSSSDTSSLTGIKVGIIKKNP